MAEEGTPPPEGAPQGTVTPEGAPPPPPEGSPAEPDWKAESRKHEKRAKESFTKVQELEEKLGKVEDANKSETEKALDKARKEARSEAESEFEKERRSDRLQVAVAKHARELADVDDVVLNLEHADTAGLFDKDGKVDQKALKDVLDGLLKDKPHLKAQGVGKPHGEADGGKGEGGEGKSFNDLLRSK